MGTWGPAIFSDDTACDIRGDYKDFLGDGLTPSESTDRILFEWRDSLDDVDERSVVWLALAAIQWKLGRLEERVRQKAVEVIESGCNLDRWEGKYREKRVVVLDKLRDQLDSPQPKQRKVSRRFRDHCEWEVGEIIAYTTLSKEKVLFRVIGFHQDKGGRSLVCELLNWRGDIIPRKLRLRFLGIQIKEYPNGYKVSQFMIGRTSERELPKDRVERLGIILKPSQDVGGFTVFWWGYLDEKLSEYFEVE
jgi:hypothetical protein